MISSPFLVWMDQCDLCNWALDKGRCLDPKCKGVDMALTSREHLLPPGVCILCEQAPADDARVVDTNATLVTGFPFKLEGRKYVCEGCLKTFAAEIGLVSDEQAQEDRRQRELAEAKLTAVFGFLHGFAEEISAGKAEDIADRSPIVVADAAEPVEQVSGLEAAVAAGTDPGAATSVGDQPEADSVQTPAAQVVPTDSDPVTEQGPTWTRAEAAQPVPAARVIEPEDAEGALQPPIREIPQAQTFVHDTVAEPAAQVVAEDASDEAIAESKAAEDARPADDNAKASKSKKADA